MKTKKLFFALLVSVLALGFTACSDDDQKGPAKEISGSYEGIITTEGFPLTANDVIVKVTYVSENQVTISLKENVMGLPVDINCPASVTIDSWDASRYNVSGMASFPYTSPEAPAGTPVKSLPVVVQGVITKYSYSGGIVLDITVGNEKSGELFPLTVTYIGDKI
jgi:hypothetical protein